jgi:MFS family permease
MESRKRLFYGWVIVGTIFLIMFVGYAIRDSFPLFYVPILDEFGKSRAETALISSISFIVYGLASFASGALLDRFGPRKTFSAGIIVIAIGLLGTSQASEIWQIFIFWGVIFSLGMAAIGFVPCNAVVSRWFVRRRAAAIGIAQAGGRESLVVMPVIQALIISLGWRDTYLVLGGIGLVTILGLTQFLHHSPQDKGLNPDGDTETEGAGEGGAKQRRRDIVVLNEEWAATDWTLFKAMKKYRLWAVFAAQLTNAIGFGIVMLHQVAFMVDVGFTAEFAAFVLLVFGIVGMAGRLSAFLADIIGREQAYTMGCIGNIIGFLMLVLTKDASSPWMLYIYAISFGFFSGINGPTLVTAAADIFQGRHFGAILGFTNIGFGLGNFIGRWYGGYVFDLSGNYLQAFITAIVSVAIACISIWIASPRRIRVVRKQ